MIKWLLRRRIDAFEKEYDYDASHLRYILNASVSAALKFGRVMGLTSYRKDVPLDAGFAAGLATTLAEDCGPCSQLVVTMAEREGVAPPTIKAVLAGDERAMTPEAALGYRFAQAVLRHDPAASCVRKSSRDGAGVRSCRWPSQSPRGACSRRSSMRSALGSRVL